MAIGFRSLPNNRAEFVGLTSEGVQSAAEDIAARLKKRDKDIVEVKIGKPKKVKGRGWVVRIHIITKK